MGDLGTRKEKKKWKTGKKTWMRGRIKRLDVEMKGSQQDEMKDMKNKQRMKEIKDDVTRAKTNEK